MFDTHCSFPRTAGWVGQVWWSAHSDRIQTCNNTHTPYTSLPPRATSCNMSLDIPEGEAEPMRRGVVRTCAVERIVDVKRTLVATHG